MTNRIKTKNTVYEITDFETKKTIKDELVVEKCFGYSIIDGKVKGGMGISLATFPDSPYYDANEFPIEYDWADPNINRFEVITYFKGYRDDGQSEHPFDRRIFFYGDDKRIYQSLPTTGHNVIIKIYEDLMVYDSRPIALNYLSNGLDTIILTGKNGPLLIWSCSRYIPRQVELGMTITSLCENDGALYATTDEGDAKTIWFTTSLDPLDFANEESTTRGLITLGDERGPCKKVISFKGYVYVFRDFGITRLTMLANGDHTVTQLYQSPSKIYANTVAVCGDKIIFLTRAGFCEFNGISVSPININVNRLIDDVNNENAFGTSLHDKYFIVCVADFKDDNIIGVENNDTYLHNAFISIDIEDYSTSIVRGIDISNMFAIKDLNMEKLIFSFNGEHQKDVGQLDASGKFFDISTQKQLTTNNLCMDSEKVLSKVEINCSMGTVIDICCDNDNIHFVACKNGDNFLLPFVKTRNIMLKITAGTNDNSWINKIKLTFTDIV